MEAYNIASILLEIPDFEYNSRNEEMCAVNIVHRLHNSTCFLIIYVVPITVFYSSATPVSVVSLTRTNKPAEMNIMNDIYTES